MQTAENAWRHVTRILHSISRNLCMCPMALILLCASTGTWASSAREGPGTIISAEAMPGAPDGATAYKILYRSESRSGELIPVSGVVIIPPGTPPPGGRPVVAWAHPTTGIESRCAPSLARVFFESVQGLRDMLARGYVVTATDYPGLGTPEVHPYLVGVSEGRAVLDSVRATRALPTAGADRRFAVWGHSQGGHAALFAGLLARQYAPELALTGIAVAAPATDLGALMRDDQGTGGGNNITAMTLWSWSRYYGASITSVVEPAAIPVIDQLAGECIERWFDVLIRREPTRALMAGFLTVGNLANTEPWKRLLALNTPGVLPPDVPVFVAQGADDRLVRPSVTDAYVKALCRNGNRVRYETFSGVGHAFIARDAANTAVEWLAGRLSGRGIDDFCSK